MARGAGPLLCMDHRPHGEAIRILANCRGYGSATFRYRFTKPAWVSRQRRSINGDAGRIGQALYGLIVVELDEKEKEMPRKPQPLTETYGIDALHMFPYYSTREQYERETGKPCPAYIDNGRPKYWQGTVPADADPDLSIRFKVAYNSKGGVSTAPDGSPKFSYLDLKPEEVIAVNIPQKNVGQWPGNTSAVEIQAPMYDLLPTEKLVFQAGIAGAQLKIRRDPLPGAPTAPSASGGFTEADRAMLKAIAGRMGL